MDHQQRTVIEERIALLDTLRREAFDQMYPGMDRKESRRLTRAAEAYRKEGERLQEQLAQATGEPAAEPTSQGASTGRTEAPSMKLPIALPDGWSAEQDPALGVIITAVDQDGCKGFVTVNEAKRAFDLGISSARPRKLYSGRYWRKELYEEAIAALQAAMR